MQPHGGAADASEHLPPLAHIVGEDALLDAIELAGEVVGEPVDRIDHVADNRFQQNRRHRDLVAAAQRVAHHLDGTQRSPAPADDQPLGHGEMEKADLLGDAVELTDEVGQDAIEAMPAGIELLVLVGGEEQVSRRRGEA